MNLVMTCFLCDADIDSPQEEIFEEWMKQNLEIVCPRCFDEYGSSGGYVQCKFVNYN